MPNKSHPKKSIKSTVSIHDRTQVETVFSYGLNPENQRKKHKYRVDAFLFFPVQTWINETTYSRQQFYNDLKAFIRLREPRLSYRELLGIAGNGEAKQSPLAFMIDFLKKPSEFNQEKTKLATDEARVFGCAFVSYFWRRIEKRFNRLLVIKHAIETTRQDEKEPLSQQFTANTIRFLAKAYELLQTWRQLNYKAAMLQEPVLGTLLYEMELVDEYCSYCFRDGLLRLLKALDDHAHAFDAASMVILRRKVTAYLRLERYYAKKHSYSWVYDSSEKVLKENYVYRRSALKKRIWSVLYLNPRADLIFKFQQQLGPMVAAGLAATWAVFTTLMIWNYSSTSNNVVGAGVASAVTAGGSLLVTALLVTSYILKDRIKELGRTWFRRGLFNRIPDFNNNIYYSTVSNQRLKIGEMQEFVEFEKTEKIPKKILDLRRANLQKYYRFEDAYGSIIHYKKLMDIDPTTLNRLPQPVRAVHDIIRLNISSYLIRLDDPMHLAFAPTADGKSVETLMPKVYHIDFILRYSLLSQEGKSSNDEVIDYYRIVLDKKGMSRIEQLK